MAETKPTATTRGKLPAELTSFVGRRRELAGTRRLLASTRLLTLTGVGGVGKTRLAMRLCAEVRRTFADGVWFVELAALHDSGLLGHTLAGALELSQVSANPTADLAEYLEDKHLLLVLDNCEHLADACAVLVSKLLAAAPQLRILATSRHVLGVEGEQIFPVPPLSTPPETELTPDDAGRYESIELFADRARSVSPEFELDAAGRPLVIELCRRLDGIPLAIELAAVWMRTLSPAQILDRIEDRFRLLATGKPAAPARQQALDAAIGWSYGLCSPAEQALWERLSVFAGGFDLEGAEEVCSGDGIDRAEVLELIAGLMNKSIITRKAMTDHSVAWYDMLGIIGQYGVDRLTAAGQARALRTRHRDYYRRMAAEWEADSFSPRQADWFIRLRREHDNFRAALDFCLSEPAEAAAALDIAAPIWNFWFAGFLREGHRYLVRALELAPEPTPARAEALWAASYLAMFLGESEQMSRLLAECEVLAERFGDDLLRARIAEVSGHALNYAGELPAAVARLEEGLAGFRAVGNHLGEFDVLILLAAATFFLGDPRVEQFSRQAFELADSHGAASSKAYALWTLGIVQWRDHDDAEQAGRSFREAIRLWLPLNDRTGIGFCVQALSWCASTAAPNELAARLMGASRAVWRSSGAHVDETTPYSQFDEQSRQRVRAALGDAAFEQAFEQGAAYSFEQAVSLALGKDTERGGAARPGRTGGLTRREHEIAVLLSEGLSNKEIAARLVIGQRTVETHVEHVLGKLAFTSRAQVARWIAETRTD
ncbi:putative ATPase [Kribbella voronezhensis]|uniref:Putative ATPase n=1 Tax=Kribbella voronezhensis TaxID=2512212 RepID=A0A4R7T540_9ACTN|nr:LuxR C-terminal-related transcriptional regulator [Kribbella voronezhensis]TDU86942.1 putative ATPase [Kribbella voronezhensis]